MNKVIFYVFFFLATHSAAFGIVYDCFLFFNELDVLNIRLHEMGPYVDKFVIVESIETFRGNLKPLYFLDNKELYKDFEDKIIHIVLTERTNHVRAWDRETFQRNQIMRGLKEARPDDLIFISDLDEILRGEKIPSIVEQMSKKNIAKCDQVMYSFHLNILHPVPWTWGTVVMRHSWLANKTPQKARTISWDSVDMVFSDAGWHFSWMGGAKVAIEKLEAFSHAELDLPQNKTPEAIKKGLGLHSWQSVKIDETFPRYVIDHLDYFIEKGFILSESEIQDLIKIGAVTN